MLSPTTFSDSCMYIRTSQIPHKLICSSRCTPRILHCHSMSSSSLGQPLVQVATAPLPTAEEENEEDVAMTEAQSDDSDSSTFSPRWERLEYIRCMRLPCEYDDWTSEELQGVSYTRRFMPKRSVSKAELRSTHAALIGWRLSSPEVTRDPMPWQDLLLLILALLQYDGPLAHGYKRAAFVHPWQLDLSSDAFTEMRPRCQCICICEHRPARGNRYLCQSHCGALVCHECVAIWSPTICHWCFNPFCNKGHSDFDGTITLCDQASERAGKAAFRYAPNMLGLPARS